MDRCAKIIPYDEILDYKVRGKTKTDDAASAAIVGGFAAGVIGAVVCAQEAQRNSSSIEITIFTKNSKQEEISFSIWGSGMAFFDSIKAIIADAIIKSKPPKEII